MTPKTPQPNIHIHTIGCRANQADSALLTAQLQTRGLRTSKTEFPVAVVINTCCVTAQAERDCRKQIRRALRNYPDATVVVTGCAVSALENFTDGFTNRVVAIGGGDVHPSVIAEKLHALTMPAASVTPATRHTPDAIVLDNDVPPPAPVCPEGRTRALLKIQNGCSHHCTYCIVPTARGPERSMNPEDILPQVIRFREAAVRELVLTGVQIGAYGADLPEDTCLSDILGPIAEAFAPGRIRISSIEPWSVDLPLLATMAQHDNICAHLHIPLQSGDDQVLRDMNRGYTTDRYREVISMVRNALPCAFIGTDVICGFPTEDNEAFENTLRLIRELNLSGVHGFSYSARPGTAASHRYGDGDRTLARNRVRRIRALGEQLNRHFVQAQIGTVCTVLIEEGNRGLTDTFVTVDIKKQTPGTLLRCQLHPSTTPDGRPVARPLEHERETP